MTRYAVVVLLLLGALRVARDQSTVAQFAVAQDTTPTADCQPTIDELSTIVWYEYNERSRVETEAARDVGTAVAYGRENRRLASRCLSGAATAEARETSEPCGWRVHGRYYLPVLVRRF